MEGGHPRPDVVILRYQLDQEWGAPQTDPTGLLCKTFFKEGYYACVADYCEWHEIAWSGLVGAEINVNIEIAIVQGDPATVPNFLGAVADAVVPVFGVINGVREAAKARNPQ